MHSDDHIIGTGWVQQRSKYVEDRGVAQLSPDWGYESQCWMTQWGEEEEERMFERGSDRRYAR